MRRRAFFGLLFFGLTLISPATQAALQARNICVWDLIGSGGPMSSLMKDAQARALSWGVKLELHTYTDETVAANDFKSSQCDGVLLSGVTVRDFSLFSGTLGAVGAIPDMEEMRTLLSTLTQAKAASLLQDDRYEVAGIFPIGPIYMFVRDKHIDSVEKLQGMKMAVLGTDQVAATMVRRIGGSVVPASLSTFSGLFNNGSVDIVFAPAIAYNSLELYKGLGDHGGIIKFPLLAGSLQLVLRVGQFPEGFGQKFREYSFTRFNDMLQSIQHAEAEIPARHWMTIDPDRKEGYIQMMRDSRISLRDQGLYDARALSLMKMIRCKFNPTHAECVQSLE